MKDDARQMDSLSRLFEITRESPGILYLTRCSDGDSLSESGPAGRLPAPWRPGQKQALRALGAQARKPAG